MRYGWWFESVSFANRAAAEVDIYGGIRPTFGAFAFDFGVWGYLYPGGTCFFGGGPGTTDPAGKPLSAECLSPVRFMFPINKNSFTLDSWPLITSLLGARLKLPEKAARC